jgi:glyoxylase-like metal-dependent hydrolase (beta-lactamase superfamily II)
MENRQEHDSHLPTTSFISRRVNASTFLIIEDDEYSEQPYIFVKVYDDHILINDTGCNTPRHKDSSLVSLRSYLETYDLPLNGHQPLNPGARKKYVIVCSHCHYDHILGLHEFCDTDAIIVASDRNKKFLSEDLTTHSLCRYVDKTVPTYTVSLWASHLERLSIDGVRFRIQFLHIPGHTPDSLAWYDMDERHLYVGDTFYERKRSKPISKLDGDHGVHDQASVNMRDAIIFPEEGGNWVELMSSLDMLLSFVQHENQDLGIWSESHSGGKVARVQISCGHMTYNMDAEEMIMEVKALFAKIIVGKVPPTYTFDKRNVVTDFWLEDEDSRYSIVAPRRIVLHARSHFSYGAL